MQDFEKHIFFSISWTTSGKSVLIHAPFVTLGEDESMLTSEKASEVWKKNDILSSASCSYVSHISLYGTEIFTFQGIYIFCIFNATSHKHL